jgi:signal transduction histidine kinase
MAIAGSVGDHVQATVDSTSPADIHDIVLFQSASEAEVFRLHPWARLAIPLRVNDATRGWLILGAKASDAPFDFQEVGFVEQAVGAGAIAGENVRLFEALQDVAEDRLRVRSAERMHLAHRLHDEPLQRTFTIAQGLEMASAALPTDHPVADLLRAQKEELRRLSGELRDICAGLRPPIMNQGLLLTLRQVVRSFDADHPSINLELILASEDEPTISEHALDAAYHVVTEALNNVARHSAAKCARVTLETMSDGIRICISDDGKGTPLSSLSLPELVRDRHFGIAGMYEWADMAGGRLRMISVAPTGTTVELYVPFSENHAC